MTLRKKTLLCLACSLTGFLVIAGLIAHAVMDQHLTALENKQVMRNLTRAQNILHAELSNLERLSRDWSSWDDAYNFVDNLSPAFIEANLPDSTFENLRLNVMLFYDSEARLVYGKAFDLDRKFEVPLPGQLLTLLRKTSRQIFAGSTRTGILLLPQQLMLLTCQPILTSLDTGPPRGTLIMGRNLTQPHLQHRPGSPEHISRRHDHAPRRTAPAAQRRLHRSCLAGSPH